MLTPFQNLYRPNVKYSLIAKNQVSDPISIKYRQLEFTSSLMPPSLGNTDLHQYFLISYAYFIMYLHLTMSSSLSHSSRRNV